MRSLLRSALPGLALGALALPAHAQVLRYSATTTGGIVMTGNTLGLSKETAANGPGVRDSIGTFIALDPSAVDAVPANAANPWFAGTTPDWTVNGSSAELRLPAGASVAYAELVWGGGYAYVDDVTASLGVSVTLTADGASHAAAPETATALTLSQTATGGFDVRYYARSAVVTDFVRAHGATRYTVSGVPATQNEAINSLSAAGWTLIVAYRSETEQVRNSSIFVGGSFVDESSQQDYAVSGFCAPPIGPISGRVMVSAIEGDANLTGDALTIAPTTAGPFATLSGPNNPATNFFCSQLNDATGARDTAGTFGTRNHDAIGGVNVSGGRQGWDVTTLPLASAAGQIANGQTSAVLRATTTGDSFVPVVLAFDIDVTAPRFGGSSGLVFSTGLVTLGDRITLTATAENTGTVPADLEFALPLDTPLGLVDYRTDGVPGDIGGAPVTRSALVTAVPAGSLAPGELRTATIVLSVDGPPTLGTEFVLTPQWTYRYSSCTGQTALRDTWAPDSVTVTYQAPVGTGGTGGTGGGAATGGSSGSGGSGATGGTVATGGSAGSAGAGGASAGGSSSGVGGGAGAGGAAGAAGAAGAGGASGAAGAGAGGSSGAGAGGSGGTTTGGTGAGGGAGISAAGAAGSGAGGASAGTGGAGYGAPASAGDDGGCGCRAPRSQPARGALLALLAALVVAVRRRR